uniref:Uncharacterized protein n=1 Tax=Aegilops tauschii subsp. strangulata TaxID=200361 RepID=A0A453MTR8_AEGTS
MVKEGLTFFKTRKRHGRSYIYMRTFTTTNEYTHTPYPYKLPSNIC